MGHEMWFEGKERGTDNRVLIHLNQVTHVIEGSGFFTVMPMGLEIEGDYNAFKDNLLRLLEGEE